VGFGILVPMSIDLVVATPSFLDLTFAGLESLPALGEERFASDLRRSPGGGAITAIGAARLGLSTVLAAPLGDDVAGELVMEVLREDGVAVVERRAPRTPTTVVLPVAGDRAMVTVDPGVRASASDVAALSPRTVAVNLDLLYVVPAGVHAYVTCGDDDARAFAGRPPAQLSAARALFVSLPEALTLTGERDVEAAARRLAELVPSVIVTLGADGAMALIEGERFDAPPFDAGKVVDATGAGDLLVAAYIWGDLRGAAPLDRLRWAVIYSGLSITTTTAVAGAVDEARLLSEGAKLGLAPPSGSRSVSAG
jgi:sugar/nucleoside kinase (ribokinase family)